MTFALNPLRRRPPGRAGFPVAPGAWPVIGHLPTLALDSLELMRRAERELGPLFWVEQGFGHHVLYCLDPAGFEIMRNRATSSSVLTAVVGEFLGDSMIVHDGARHQHIRSAMGGPFTPRGLTALELGPVFAATIRERVARWRDVGEVQILAETRELAIELMFRMMGIRERDLSTWREHYETYVLLAWNMPIELPGFPRWRGRRAKAWLDAQLLARIRAAREHDGEPGLLRELVHARDDGGLQLGDSELIDNLRFLLLAGHETSATVMAWMVIELARRPDLWARLREEAAAGDVPVTPKELRGFPFAEAIFRESSRLHPPTSMDARIVTGELELLGRQIPAGAMVGVSLAHLSRHPALFADGDAFVPERWLDRKQPLSPLELAQFGGGPHFCLGYHLAWMEIVQFAVALAHAMNDAGLRPAPCGPPPRTHYLPLAHPAPGTRVRFVRTLGATDRGP